MIDKYLSYYILHRDNYLTFNKICKIHTYVFLLLIKYIRDSHILMKGYP